MSDQLNPHQQKAVTHISSPLLVLAGAGSGKTRVITQKIAYLIKEHIHLPEHIAAVTFTNKAAREMKQRVGKLLNENDTGQVRVSTFHTLGLNIIRKERKAIGLKSGFTIYDSHDSSALILELIRKDFGSANGLEDTIRWQISSWKNAFISPEQALNLSTNPKEASFAKLYERYNHFLRTYNAVDFDDLISLPVTLFNEQPDILATWRERIRYLLVDEYQDTNASQYHLVKLLVGNRKGLTVVGDDDQSIYGWRGAQPENLHLLHDDYQDLEVIKLEQNYRSMGNILQAANQLISNNPHQFEKSLWSDMGPGESIKILQCKNGDHEAERVISHLMHHRFKTNSRYKEYAILYRGNHQARPFERMLREHRIPYILSGGISFFDRTEIKDLMAYLRLLINPDDDTAFLRAVNTPRRGLGPSTIEKLAEFANRSKLSLLAASMAPEISEHMSTRAVGLLDTFSRLITEANYKVELDDPVAAVKELIDKINYEKWVEDQSPDPQAAERRLDNVQELIDWLLRLQKSSESSLADMLSHMCLMDILDRDEQENTDDAVHLMTLHSAKGLEFNYVYIVGMEEDLLPNRNCVEESLDEERRLAYVGITRARRELCFSMANYRKRFGEIMDCVPSRFLEELPQDKLHWEGKEAADPEERKERGKSHLAHMRSMLT